MKARFTHTSPTPTRPAAQHALRAQRTFANLLFPKNKNALSIPLPPPHFAAVSGKPDKFERGEVLNGLKGRIQGFVKDPIVITTPRYKVTSKPVHELFIFDIDYLESRAVVLQELFYRYDEAAWDFHAFQSFIVT